MFNKSFLKIFIMIPIGVTTKKNTIPITIGEIIFPKNKPNFIQNRLNGVRYFESKIPKIKNMKAAIIDQILISSYSNIGHKPIIKKNAKKTKPKLRFELIQTFLFIITI